MYKNIAYKITTKTNLHVGSGDTNYGIVDKLVQRDTITNLPVINGSSLKGALRDHFKDMLEQKIDDTSKHFKKLFGDGNNQGLIKFIDAKLLFLPLRSNKKPFYHVTSVETLNDFKELLESFGIGLDIENIDDLKKSVVIGGEEGTIIEDVECKKADNINIDKIKKLFGIKNLAIFTEEDFNEAISNLPVIARNSLEGNGNLWYEEVVPRESIFVSILSFYNNIYQYGKDEKVINTQYKKFQDKLDNDTIEIGANISIGFGVTKFSKLGESNE